MKVLLLAVTLACSLFFSEGHVRLTFPPARLPHYDFLDNVRTQGPCGTPIMDTTPVTTLMTGSQFQLSFHLAYAHRGGLSIRILHSNGSIAHVLLPEDGNSTYLVGEEDGTTQRLNITLPSDFECEQCTLQLIRNAREWGTTIGEPYLFWSCAEVQITTSPVSPCPGDCGSGTCDNMTGVCQCPRGYYGPYCHLKNECEDTSDCNNNGMCVDILSTNVPTRQCFCYPGYHGPRCQLPSELGLTDVDQLDVSEYTIKRELHSALTMYSRIIDDELEVAVVLNDPAWVAIGFRDPSADGNCYQSAPGFLPFNASNIYDHSVVVVPLPEGGAEEGGAEEGGAEEGGAEEGGAEEGGAEEGGAEEGGTEEGGAEEGGAEEGATEEGGAEEGATEEGGAEEGGAEEGGAEEGGTGEGSGGALHAMDCTDIIIIGARGTTHRIRDYYTRDRSMPQEDEMYGGSYSLTSAVAIERDGKTTAIFRRKLNSTDGYPDYDIINTAMHVIWAIGQTPGNVAHSPQSSIEANEASNTDFYQPDEVKYHGSDNRGSTQINFFIPDPVSSDLCRGLYRHPDCTPGRDCPYEAEWVVSGSSVRFRVSSNVAATNWVALGFSNDQNMANSDIIAGAANGDQSFISDRYATGQTEPAIDANEGISDATIVRENGRTVMDFVRPLISTDAQDISLNQCVFFLYAARGGLVNDFDSRSIAYHDETPLVSPVQVCLPQPGQCTGSLEFQVLESSSAVFKPSVALLASVVTVLLAAMFL